MYVTMCLFFHDGFIVHMCLLVCMCMCVYTILWYQNVLLFFKHSLSMIIFQVGWLSRKLQISEEIHLLPSIRKPCANILASYVGAGAETLSLMFIQQALNPLNHLLNSFYIMNVLSTYFVPHQTVCIKI